MSTPRLVEPSRDFEASYGIYVAELQSKSEPLVPFPLALPHTNFDELLATLAANSLGQRLPAGFVANSTFWLVVGTEIVAISNLRHSLTPALERRGGHIGYSVRPSCRRQGYGSHLLALTLLEAAKLGLSAVLITCAKDNTGSVKVIRANGGVLQSEEFLPEHGEVVQRYRVPTMQPNNQLERDMAHFPKLLRDLPAFDGPFDAFKLEAKNCDVLFASYPGGTVIPPHSHATENVGVITQGELILTLGGKETRYRAGEWYHVPAKATHAARFEVETSEIEFWFHERPRGNPGL